MKCPYCSSTDTRVLEKRDVEEQGITRRRRECLKCGKRFTTYERVELVELIVLKKDGRREQFNRDKIRNGITRACEKRPVSHEQIENIVDEIEAKLRKKETKEISSKEIGEEVIKKLKTLDKVAYIRFASVYRDFGDIESFQEELGKLLRKRGKK